MTFDYWTVESNVTLRIYDGPNAAGTPLHTGNGFTKANPPVGAIVAKSGALYMSWTSTGTATNKGFRARWSTVQGAKIPPVAKFDIATNLYNAV